VDTFSNGIDDNCLRCLCFVSYLCFIT
jgi:hypothetical protein